MTDPRPSAFELSAVEDFVRALRELDEDRRASLFVAAATLLGFTERELLTHALARATCHAVSRRLAP